MKGSCQATGASLLEATLQTIAENRDLLKLSSRPTHQTT